MNRFRQYYLACLLLTCAIFAQAQSRFNTPDAIQGWIDTYYQQPQPRQLLEVMQSASRQGLLSQEYRWSELTGFIAGVVGRNPQLAAPLGDLVQTFPATQRQPFILGLVYANNADSRAALKKLGAKLPDYKAGIDRYLLLPSPDITKVLPLEGNPSAIDANWGYFQATGDERAVIRIISALPWSALKEDGTPQTLSHIAVGRVAFASLREHAIKHPRVMTICRQQVGKQPKNVAGPLRAVISQAQASIAKTASTKGKK